MLIPLRTRPHFVETGNGTEAGPILCLERRKSDADASDEVGAIQWVASDASGQKQNVAAIHATLMSADAETFRGSLSMRVNPDGEVMLELADEGVKIPSLSAGPVRSNEEGLLRVAAITSSDLDSEFTLDVSKIVGLGDCAVLDPEGLSISSSQVDGLGDLATTSMVELSLTASQISDLGECATLNQSELAVAWSQLVSTPPFGDLATAAGPTGVTGTCVLGGSGSDPSGYENIVAASDETVLRRTGGSISFGQLTTECHGDATITAPKLEVSQRFEPGDIKVSARSSASDGWLLCDGAAISRATYADLFAAIGANYGSGDGTTTFNLPDFRGRVIVGAGTGLATNSTPPSGSGLTARSRGDYFGAETHTLDISQMPSHTHTPTVGALVVYVGTGGSTHVSAGTSTLSSPLNNVGGGGAHNNIQPAGVANVFIKY